MLTHFPAKKRIHSRLFGFTCFLLAIMITGNEAASMKSSTSFSKKPLCKAKSQKVHRDFTMSDLLFSVSGFGLYEVENAGSE